MFNTFVLGISIIIIYLINLSAHLIVLHPIIKYERNWLLVTFCFEFFLASAQRVHFNVKLV